MNSRLKKDILATLLGTLAFLIMLLVSIPVIPAATFLKYDPSGFLLLLSGALLGPACGVLSCFIKGFLYFITGAGNIFGVTSDFLANIIFMIPAVLVMRRGGGSVKASAAGCALGTVLATLAMIPINLVVLRLELGLMPDAVMAMMIPAILPFNLLKGVLNSVIYFLAGRPLSRLVARRSERVGSGRE
ncbi:ECF transporter S component [uncultured Pseudoflavonifractor sp.]|uniref:ECF transporter S component n=1 Tax=uncultured Pseudoflavonifractor sp. TaxID=1221379 RepID=UPI0025DEB503|nr:ECF transporter S component [uncultured Pseudoflavonifractor sp.]